MLQTLAQFGPNGTIAVADLTVHDPEQVALKRLLDRDIVELVGEESSDVRFEIELVRLWWLGDNQEFCWS